MRRAFRFLVITGVALVGAGIIAVAPVEASPPSPDAQPGSVQLTGLPLPLVDWAQFEANTAASWASLINFPTDFSGLAQPGFFGNLGALLIEGSMAWSIATSPSAVINAALGLAADYQTLFAAGDYTTIYSDEANVIPTLLNAYLNGIPPTDGLLTAVSASPPPYESGNLVQMLVQTITDQSKWLAGDHTLVPLNLADWTGTVPVGETAGSLYFDLPTALQTLLAGPLSGLGSFLGLSLTGSELNMNIPHLISGLIGPGGLFHGLASALGLTVNGNNVDMNLQALFNNLWPGHPGWVNVTSGGTIDVTVCGGGGIIGDCTIHTPWPLPDVHICSDILSSSDCPVFPVAIGNPTFEVQTGSTTPILDLGPPTSVVALGDNYMAGVPQYDLDLAKDMLALQGQSTAQTWNLDVNSLLPASLGLSIAGGDDLHVNGTNLLAELLHLLFPQP